MRQWRSITVLLMCWWRRMACAGGWQSNSYYKYLLSGHGWASNLRDSWNYFCREATENLPNSVAIRVNLEPKLTRKNSFQQPEKSTICLVEGEEGREGPKTDKERSNNLGTFTLYFWCKWTCNAENTLPPPHYFTRKQFAGLGKVKLVFSAPEGRSRRSFFFVYVVQITNPSSFCHCVSLWWNPKWLFNAFSCSDIAVTAADSSVAYGGDDGSDYDDDDYVAGQESKERRICPTRKWLPGQWRP